MAGEPGREGAGLTAIGQLRSHSLGRLFWRFRGCDPPMRCVQTRSFFPSRRPPSALPRPLGISAHCQGTGAWELCASFRIAAAWVEGPLNPTRIGEFGGIASPGSPDLRACSSSIFPWQPPKRYRRGVASLSASASYSTTTTSTSAWQTGSVSMGGAYHQQQPMHGVVS